ncbi:MAG: protoheme IX farnesyltransferase [Rhodothermales bacterium]|nr:protoheme IX farnesyltransferase [Rhodothermales bacterium]
MAPDTIASWRHYVTLAKPEITFLVTISALAGYLVGSSGGIDALNVTVTMVGIALCSACASALNHAAESRFDALMDRTSGRPVPSGIISPSRARWFGYLTGAAGLGLLCPLVNPLTAILASVTIVLYVFVYTPLKRKTTLNTLVGTLPGAIPVIGGYAAATGRIDLAALPLFAVLLFWQMPHFLSLAWMYRDDYARGGFQMLPSVEEDGVRTGRQSLIFALATLGASLTLILVSDVTIVYPIAAIILGGYFCYKALSFHLDRNRHTAKQLFKASIWYVPAMLVLMLFEHFA